MSWACVCKKISEQDLCEDSEAGTVCGACKEHCERLLKEAHELDQP